MNGNGISPEIPVNTPAPGAVYKPYREGIQPGVIDMKAFVNDLRTFWPRKAGSSSAASTLHHNNGIFQLAAAWIALCVGLMSVW